jgi:hypothetical protein
MWSRGYLLAHIPIGKQGERGLFQTIPRGGSLEASRVGKAPHVLLQDLDGEAVLLNLSNGHYYGLDAISFRMYSLLVGSETVQAAYEQLLQEYEVAPEQLRADLERFLKHLLDNGLVLRLDDKP